MASPQHSDISSDHEINHEIDRIVERIRQDIPDIPYYLSVPSECPYRLLNPALRDQWRRDTWFEPHEEHLQYSTFVWRDSATSPFQLYPFPADDPGKPAGMASDLAPIPNTAPKKKITLAAYKNKSKASATATEQTSQDLPQVPSVASNTPRPSSEIVDGSRRKSVRNGATESLATAMKQVSTEGNDVEEAEAYANATSGPETTKSQPDAAMDSMPWLPSSHTQASFEHLPPRLSPLIPTNSILHMPSPGGLQRHALSSLVGTKSSPLQVTLSLPSNFATDLEVPSRPDKEHAPQTETDHAQSSLVVKLRVPSLKQRKKRASDGDEDESSSKRPKSDHTNRFNGDAVSTPRQNDKMMPDSFQASPASLKSKTIVAEWQTETVRISKLGRISKSTSAEVYRESEMSTDVKVQMRLRKVAGIHALEALLRFLQSFVAKSQSRTNPKMLLLDWISFMPYSSDVVAVTRHSPHLQGLALLLQSVASSQIVAVCSSLRLADDTGNSNSKDGSSVKEAIETLSMLQKYGLYTQQKSAEAGKILTRKMLAENYPKAYATSLEQPFGSGLQPMQAFRMAVQLLDEWSSHQGIEWQPLDEGLCSRL